MPLLVPVPSGIRRQQPPAGVSLRDPHRWAVAACLNTPIHNSAGVNNVGWSTGGINGGSVFLSGSDPSELTQTPDGVVVKNVSDTATGAELKVSGIASGDELIGSFIFVFKNATTLSTNIMFISDKSNNYIRYYSNKTFRVYINGRSTYHNTIPDMIDGAPHTLAVRLHKGEKLNRAVFLDGRFVDAQDQSDTAVSGWDDTDSAIPPRIFAWETNYARYWDAVNQLFCYTTDYLPDSELIAYTENPWQIFKPRPARFISIPISSGGTTHALTGSGATADTLANTGTATQTHILAGAASALDALANTGTVTQTHALIGTGTAADTLATTGAATQTHTLTGSGTTADTLANTGEVYSGTVHVLTGISGVADCLAATRDIIQTHALAGDGNLLDALANTGAITQTHALTALGAMISTLSGTISLAGLLPAPNTPQIRGVTPKFGARRHSSLFTIRSVD